MCLQRSDRGTSPLAMSIAMPSTTAVLPTPASPIRQGLFLLRRESICTVRRISRLLPIIGSHFFSAASRTRSFPYLFRAVCETSRVRFVQAELRLPKLPPSSFNIVTAVDSLCSSKAERRCSVPVSREPQEAAILLAEVSILCAQEVIQSSSTGQGSPMPTSSIIFARTSASVMPQTRNACAAEQLCSDISESRICSLPT